jgi:hypothetical protein
VREPRMLRLLPAAASAALLLFAAFAGGARTGRAAPARAEVVGCAAGQLGGTDALFSLTQYTGVRQPFDGTVPAAACTLALDYAYSSALGQVQFWNPLTLAPEASLVALRSIGYDTSKMMYNHLRMDFSPPLVVTSVPGVAEPAPVSLAFDFQVTGAYASQGVHYWSSGPAGAPTAYSYTTLGSSPLPGAHPVLGLGVCPPDGPGQDLRVLQSVMAGDMLPGLWYHDYVQKFRVPQRCELHHVELAFGANTYTSVHVGHVAVLDATGQSSPPAVQPPALAEADFYLYRQTSGWDTHYDFAAYPVLQPGHDYWLWVYAGFSYSFFLKHRSGAEPPDFQAAIGELFAREGPYQAWVGQPGYAMDFRLVGLPLANGVSVPPPAPVRGLRLSIEPNPATSAAMVRWSGAAGGARFEVLDARGRRVSTFDGAGDAGTWLWRAVPDGGGTLPAGVYFVRATDRSGATGTARLVLVR